MVWVQTFGCEIFQSDNAQNVFFKKEDESWCTNYIINKKVKCVCWFVSAEQQAATVAELVQVSAQRDAHQALMAANRYIYILSLNTPMLSIGLSLVTRFWPTILLCQDDLV